MRTLNGFKVLPVWRPFRRRPQPGAGPTGISHGMTLVEVCIAAYCSAVIISASVLGIVMATAEAATTAQHTSAMSLCEERLEAMRAEQDLTRITTTYYPSQTNLELTHTESPSTIIIYCNRTVVITDESTAAITAKRVTITVNWTFRAQPQQESITGIIYDKR